MSGLEIRQQQPAPRRQPTPAEVLATPVEFVPGVGPQRAALLARLDIRTAGDLPAICSSSFRAITRT
jgi:hypothetical protein